MSTTTDPASESERTGRVIDLLIRLGVVALLLYACWSILFPFLGPVVWGAVLAVALAPLHGSLSAKLGGRNKMAATLITLAGLAVIIVPTVVLTYSAVKSGLGFAAGVRDGSVKLPPPSESVQEWPVVGESLFDAWTLAHTNTEEAIQQWGPEIAQAAGKAASVGGGLVVQALFFALALLLAGVFLAFAESSETFTRRFAERIAPGKGAGVIELSTSTMRSVAKGVLGVAVIQALLAGIGLLVAGVPGAGLWALGVLILAVVQLPPSLILIVPAVWYFSLAGTGAAITLAIYLFVVSIADTFLKPMLLGRGLDVPMPVILLGAIGGMLWMGIIGLFTGAVTLALGFTLFQAWLEMGAATEGESDDAGAPAVET